MSFDQFLGSLSLEQRSAFLAHIRNLVRTAFLFMLFASFGGGLAVFSVLKSLGW